MRKRQILPVLMLVFAIAAITLDASAQEHWVVTWAAAPQQPAGLGQRGGRGGAPAAAAPGAPSGTTAPAPAVAPAPAPAPPATGYNNQTLRMFVRTSIGGRRVRVQVSNAFGTTPLTVGAAHIALHAKDSAIVPGSDRPLMFGGKPSIKIPPGADAVSDPVNLNVPALADLAISVYVPAETGPASRHSMALRTGYVGAGDMTAAPEMTEAATTNAWIFVSGVDVLAPANAATVVAFGDSITDGATSTPNTNGSWPSVLAERLQGNNATKNLSIVNMGISGNRILADGAGVSALSRFDRDVLSQPGVKYLMILEGINDINGSRQNPISADDLIVAMKQMIEKAHTHAIKVIGCTLTPAGAGTGPTEEMRVAVNDWIRKGGAFDSVVDFEAAVRDPANPTQFKKEFNNTDRLHPNDAGYRAMANSIDLKIFTQK